LRLEIGGPSASLPVVVGDASYNPTAVGPGCFDQDGYMTHINPVLILVARLLSISINFLPIIANNFSSE
jgi:hypothetical protein